MREEGGIYADIDSELRAPLHTLIRAEAVALVTPEWMYEFLAYTPHHPIIRETLRIAVSLVRSEARLLAIGSNVSCRTPHSCVMKVTGPDVYYTAIYNEGRAANCTNTGSLIQLRTSCGPKSADALRLIQQVRCEREREYRFTSVPSRRGAAGPSRRRRRRTS